jgi:hypothetical protein
MKRNKDLKSPERRDFFTKAGVGLGAAGAVVTGLTGGAAQAETKTDRGFKKAQYQETEHVRRAYETSRF